MNLVEMISAAEIRDRLINAGLCNPARLQGYTDLEIAQFQQEVGERFPAQYVEFLRAAGKCAEGYFTGSIVAGPEVFGLREDFETELRQLREDEPENPLASWRLPEHSLPFFSHGGNHFWFFVCEGADDPRVYSFRFDKELNAEAKLTLSQWICQSIQFLVEERTALQQR